MLWISFQSRLVAFYLSSKPEWKWWCLSEALPAFHIWLLRHWSQMDIRCGREWKLKSILQVWDRLNQSRKPRTNLNCFRSICWCLTSLHGSIKRRYFRWLQCQYSLLEPKLVYHPRKVFLVLWGRFCESRWISLSTVPVRKRWSIRGSLSCYSAESIKRRKFSKMVDIIPYYLSGLTDDHNWGRS